MRDFNIGSAVNVFVHEGVGDQNISLPSNIDIVKHGNQMISELENAKENVSIEKKALLEEAAQSIRDGKESRLCNVLKTASDFFKEVFSSVVGSVVYQYMKQNNIV